jgi:hypothetical protein
MEYREQLLEYLITDFIDRDNSYFSMHMDSFVGKADIMAYLAEGFIVLEELIQICKENKWLDDFIPFFRLYLKKNERLEKNPNQSMLRSVDGLVRHLDKSIPPEIYLTKKIMCVGSCMDGMGTYKIGDSGFESHSYTLLNKTFHELFNFPRNNLTKNIYIKYSQVKENYDYYLDKTSPTYARCIDIIYNRNNTRVVKCVDRLTLRDGGALDFYRKYKLKHGEQI